MFCHAVRVFLHFHIQILLVGIETMVINNNNLIQTQLTKFDGKNFNHWSLKLRCLLKSKEIWNFVKNSYTEGACQKEFDALQKHKEPCGLQEPYGLQKYCFYASLGGIQEPCGPQEPCCLRRTSIGGLMLCS